MQNLLTKQERDCAYNTDLHELQKNYHLNYHIELGKIEKPHFPNKHFMRYQYIPN